MVFIRESERPPLSLILPRLYLGAETDVTEDCLSCRGISYVLSVSRCCPEPTFLPRSQYLRIPIDDSLRDDMLPWIPGALRFIDGAMAQGCSVLVHCAAGVSRSPALAVAYIMYHLGMDLDHAYRFVKECRPSISPNFNFLGQLQYFQGILAQKNTNVNPTAQTLNPLDTCLQLTNDNNSYSSTFQLSANQSVHFHDTEKIELRTSERGETATPVSTGNSQWNQQDASELTLSLSDKLRTLTLSLNPKAPGLADVMTPNQNEETKPRPDSSQTKARQSLSAFASLADKRRSLTLSLSSVGVIPQTHLKKATEIHSSKSQPLDNRSTSKTIQKRELGASGRAKRSESKSTAEASDRQQRELGSLRTKGTRQSRSTQKKQSGEKERPIPAAQPESNLSRANVEKDSQRSSTVPECNSVAQQSNPTEFQCSTLEAVESEQGHLSPLNLTFNKLLGWGERLLMGVLFGPRIKMGQAALSYRC